MQSFSGTNTQQVALSMPGMAPALVQDFPEVAMATRIQGGSKALIRKDDNRILVPACWP